MSTTMTGNSFPATTYKRVMDWISRSGEAGRVDIRLTLNIALSDLVRECLDGEFVGEAVSRKTVEGCLRQLSAKLGVERYD